MNKRGTYRKYLAKKIEQERVFLNDYETKVTDFIDTGEADIVVVGGKLRTLAEDDNLIITSKMTE